MHCALVEPKPKCEMCREGRGAGAQVVVPHRGPARALVQGGRLAEVQPAPLLQHLQLPQVLLGRLPVLALPSPFPVGQRGCAEGGRASRDVRTGVDHRVDEGQHLGRDDAHRLRAPAPAVAGGDGLVGGAHLPLRPRVGQLVGQLHERVGGRAQRLDPLGADLGEGQRGRGGVRGVRGEGRRGVLDRRLQRPVQDEGERPPPVGPTPERGAAGHRARARPARRRPGRGWSCRRASSARR